MNARLSSAAANGKNRQDARLYRSEFARQNIIRHIFACLVMLKRG